MLNDRLVIPRYSGDFDLPDSISTELIPVESTEMVWDKDAMKYEPRTFRTGGIAAYNLKFKSGVLEDWYAESPIAKSLSRPAIHPSSLESSVGKADGLKRKISEDVEILMILKRVRRSMNLGLDCIKGQRELTRLMGPKDLELFATGDLAKLIKRIDMRRRQRAKALSKLEATKGTSYV